MGKRNKKGRSNSGPPFLRLYRHVKRSAQYHALSMKARCALIELIDRYHGINNGMIGLGARELADALKCSKSTAARALIELDDAGFIRPIKIGVWRGQQATEWRLTFFRCDATGAPPKTNWKTVSQSQNRAAPVSKPATRKPPSVTGGTRTRKNPTDGNSPSLTHGTHLDIYQSDRGSDASATQATCTPELPAFLDRRTETGRATA